MTRFLDWGVTPIWGLTLFLHCSTFDAIFTLFNFDAIFTLFKFDASFTLFVLTVDLDWWILTLVLQCPDLDCIKY